MGERSLDATAGNPQSAGDKAWRKRCAARSTGVHDRPWHNLMNLNLTLGPFNVTQMGVGGGGVWFSGKKRYEGVMFNVISITSGWVGVQFPEK